MESLPKTYDDLRATKGNLLLVDDEETFLKLLTQIFSKHFNVRTATSGRRALEIIDQGFRPGVIVTDQRMPIMTGAEFLEASMEIVPDAVRIILSGYTTPKDIIAAINQGHAYMYMVKPSEELELIQAVRIGFEHYYSKIINQNLESQLTETIRDLQNQNDRISKLITDKKMYLTQSMQALSGLLYLNESFYFNNHTQAVSVIAKAVAEEMNLEPDYASNTVFSALIHLAPSLGMPQKYLLQDPYDMDEYHLQIYFQHFSKVIKFLGKVQLYEPITRILSQIWEHYDGSGYPEGRSGLNVSRESQIIAIANIYHNNVYRLQPSQLNDLLHSGEISQTKLETTKRHNETIKFLYKKVNWFDADVFGAFHTLVKTRECEPLVPYDDILKIKYKDYETGRNKQSKTISSDSEKSDIIIREEEEFIEKDIPSAQVKTGMIAAQNIFSTNGILVCRIGSKFDDNLVKNIKKLESNGLISEEITVKIPANPSQD